MHTVLTLTSCHSSSPPVAPNITEPPTNTIAVAPDAATFTCVATGVLRPTISWYRVELNDTLTLLTDDDAEVSIMDESIDERTLVSSLVIENTRPSKATEYVCEATNDASTDSAMAVLTVYGKLIGYWNQLGAGLH